MIHPTPSSSAQPPIESWPRRNPDFARKLQDMAQPLIPLVRLDTGAVPVDFPSTILQFWLLTDAQLERLAVFYHQAPPAAGGTLSPWACQYPCPVRWRSDAPLEEKRRRMGRFIGLGGYHLVGEEEEEEEEEDEEKAALQREEEIERDTRMARLHVEKHNPTSGVDWRDGNGTLRRQSIRQDQNALQKKGRRDGNQGRKRSAKDACQDSDAEVRNKKKRTKD
ncbi:hypothetical protein PWT90_02035 [Aphanocladium album]|nr:hypothetical protein PWT90_02035 [Aphanocladium album]